MILDEIDATTELMHSITPLKAFRENQDDIRSLVKQTQDYLSALNARLNSMHTIERNGQVVQKATDMWDMSLIDGFKEKEPELASLKGQLQVWYDKWSGK